MTSEMNILLIARHFPPLVSGGARRWRLLTMGLAELGVNVRVIAPALPDDTQGVVAPHPAAEPNSASSPAAPSTPARPLRDWLRANLALPDPDIRWSLRAAAMAKQLQGFQPDWVISTSPPESAHVAGYLAARHHGCRWLADLRDQWLVEPLLPQRHGALRRASEGWLARRLLGNASLLTAPQTSILDEAATYAPRVDTLLLPQPGYLVGRSHAPSPRGDADIRIVHTGSFSLSHDRRTITPALDLLTSARAVDERFQLVLVGRLTDEEQRQANMTPGVRAVGVTSLEEAWRAQAEADILLLVAADDTVAVPGKLAEYQAAGRPIVCLGGGAWRHAIAGAEQDASGLLLSLRDRDTRAQLTARQREGAVSAQDAARLLLETLRLSPASE